MILLGSNHYLSAGSTNTHSIDLELSSSQYLSITDAAQTGLDLTGDFTIEAWVNFESTNTSGQSIVGKWNTSNFTTIFTHYASDNTIRLWNSSTGANAGYAGWSFTPILSTWYHLAVTFDVSAGSAELYINGVSQGTQTGTLFTSTYDGNADFRIGGWQSISGRYFDGLIDDVRIWNDIRTSTEIANNYNKQLVGNEAGLVAYYQFNNNANDLTSNNNDLTENNSPTYSTTVPF